MELSQACAIVTQYAADNTNGDFLEAMMELSLLNRMDELDGPLRPAFFLVMQAGQKMFEPVDA